MGHYSLLQDLVQVINLTKALKGKQNCTVNDSLHKTISLSLSVRFNGHSPGEPGLAGVY